MGYALSQFGLRSVPNTNLVFTIPISCFVSFVSPLLDLSEPTGSGASTSLNQLNVRPTTPDLQPTTPDLQPTTPDLQPTTPDLQPTTPDLRPTTHEPRPDSPGSPWSRQDVRTQPENVPLPVSGPTSPPSVSDPVTDFEKPPETVTPEGRGARIRKPSDYIRRIAEGTGVSDNRSKASTYLKGMQVPSTTSIIFEEFDNTAKGNVDEEDV
ncbi:hypothetical protein BU17DRAFT_89846 [Hysterangium stoloniferum]|nr:hypothetical protein BU17DRAFT_89846 [Hysterangium stoloniferum]